jgi:lipopolysaccharide biosynthesis glycosyltransferase
VIPIFIGRDKVEDIAWHVLAHSLIKHSSESLALTPIGNDTIKKELWWRQRGEHDSTEFSNARFAVPALMNFTGWAIFMDCDMICLGDIAELWAQRDDKYAVMVVKHDHNPTEDTKFLGATQSKYQRKNWSSLMLINCGHDACSELTPAYINTVNGLDLHRLWWCTDNEIGTITGLWNVLVAHGHQHPEPVALDRLKLLHYTLGGGWHGYETDGFEYWREGFKDLLAGDNPCADVRIHSTEPGRLSYAGCYQRIGP